MHCFVSGSECFLWRNGMGESVTANASYLLVWTVWTSERGERFSTHPRLLFAFLCHSIAIWNVVRVIPRVSNRFTLRQYDLYPRFFILVPSPMLCHCESLTTVFSRPIIITIAYYKTVEKFGITTFCAKFFFAPPLSILLSFAYPRPSLSCATPIRISLPLIHWCCCCFCSSVLSSVWGGVGL